MYVCEKGLAFLISHLTRQRHFSGPLFIVRGHAMTWAGSGRDLGLSEVTATCIWRNLVPRVSPLSLPGALRGETLGTRLHLAEHSTRSVVLLNVSLHRADESQVARNSCPRLPRLILGLVSIMSLSC